MQWLFLEDCLVWLKAGFARGVEEGRVCLHLYVFCLRDVVIIVVLSLLIPWPQEQTLFANQTQMPSPLWHRGGSNTVDFL